MSGGFALLFCRIVPDDRRLFIRFRTSGGSACIWEGKTPRKRVNSRQSSRKRANSRQSSWKRANFRHIVPDDRRLFIRFRTSGGSAYVWERKTPRKQAGFRHPSRERANFRHSFEARGRMAVSFQNEGEESIAEGSYKRMVLPGPHIHISHISRKYCRGRV